MNHRKFRRPASLWPLLGGPVLVFGWASCTKTEPIAEPTPTEHLTYQPFAAAFVGTTHRSVVQEFDGQAVTNESGLRIYFHVEVEPLGDQQAASFTLDSVMQLEGPAGDMMSDQYDSARGATFTGVLAADGELSNWSGGDSAGELVHQLADQFFRNFFPQIPDTGLTEGLSWSDSVQTTALVGGAETVLNAALSNNVSGWTEFQGNQVLEIVSESRYTFSGTGVQVGQSFTITGQGRRHSHHYVSSAGQYLGSISADTSDAEAEITAAGILVPVRQMRTDSLFKAP